MRGDPLAADAIDRVPALAKRLGDIPALPTLLHAELVGTYRSLLDALGPLPFARRLRNAVLRWNTRALPPRDDFDPSLFARYWRALRHLGRWEHGGVVVAHLLRNCALAPEVESELAHLWLRLDRPAARDWIDAQIRAASSSERRVQVAQWLTCSAAREDLPLLHRLLDSADPRVRAEAIRPLARRLEHGERWTATLHALATLDDEVGDVARDVLERPKTERSLPELMRDYFSSRDDFALDSTRGLIVSRWL